MVPVLLCDSFFFLCFVRASFFLSRKSDAREQEISDFGLMLSEAEQEREGEKESARERETDKGMQRPNGGPRSKGHALLVSLSLAPALGCSFSLAPRRARIVARE